MKMNSYRRNSGRNAPLWGVAALVLAIAALFAIDRISTGSVNGLVRAGAGTASSFVAAMGAAVDGSGFFSRNSTLARENEDLRREIALHAENIAQAEYLRMENDALREMARLAQQESGRTARVLTSFEATPYGTFLIDAGEDAGVRVDDIVLSPGGFILGIVRSATGDRATVESLFSPGALVEVRAGEIAFQAEGRGGGNARAQVPREAAVTLGMPVIAQAYQRNAGTIMHIESASSSATADLSIRIPVNLDTLQFVYVVAR